MNELISQERNIPAPSGNNQMMINRQAQEVQAAMVIAKKFPRDEFEASERIKRACQRKSLAEQAVYSYPRGGERVSGPSIRLAETLAKNWGNIDYGVIETDQRDGESEMMAYAWDLETNTRVTKIFTVEHKRDTKKGSYKLTDSRDIYEATANFGARRMRACILGIIPGDVVDMAVEECKKTMNNGDTRPMQERIAQMLAVFKQDFGVTKEKIEEYVGRPAGAYGVEDIILLQGVYKAIKDGQATVESYFPKKEAVAEPLGVPDDIVKEAEEHFK
nr:MAG TPA: hypothetical protein [Caudoviricetes sp.]